MGKVDGLALPYGHVQEEILALSVNAIMQRALTEVEVPKDQTIDWFSVLLLTGECGTWIGGHDSGREPDVSGAAMVVTARVRLSEKGRTGCLGHSFSWVA